MKIKAILKKYSIALIIGISMCLLVLSGNDFSTQSLVDKYRILTDAFSIPGIVFIMVGALVFVSTEGFFDMLSYGLGKFASSLIPFNRKKDESFFDYKTRKNEERFSGYSFLFYVGIFFLVIAGVFMILFFSVYN